MVRYLLIESRDPYESGGVRRDLELAAALAAGGNRVTLFLVQNGVFPLRANALRDDLQDVLRKGVEVLADDFSLRERGIDAGALRDGVRAVPLDTVVDELATGTRTIWL